MSRTSDMQLFAGLLPPLVREEGRSGKEVWGSCGNVGVIW